MSPRGHQELSSFSRVKSIFWERGGHQGVTKKEYSVYDFDVYNSGRPLTFQAFVDGLVIGVGPTLGLLAWLYEKDRMRLKHNALLE